MILQAIELIKRFKEIYLCVYILVWSEESTLKVCESIVESAFMTTDFQNCANTATGALHFRVRIIFEFCN